MGTACGPPDGDVLGEDFGEVVGREDGDGWLPTIGVLPRFASTITPTVPRINTIATATAAGMSQAGRSEGPPPADLGRWPEGLRAGADGGAVGRIGAGIGGGNG